MVGALPTNTQPIQRRWAHDQEIQRVWFGKEGGGEEPIFGFQLGPLLEMLCWDGIFPKRGGRQLGPLDAYQKGR